ncbi:MAG: DUF167 domain-containing protein [Alphaproteobacteria bacterium]|nr:DUF167 domain-containing protein [Alphaproteobacteria bacterium]
MSDLSGDFSGILSRFEGGVRLSVKAKPGSSRARKLRFVPLAGGKWAVEIAVAAAPEDGKANKAILAFLADELDLPKNNFSIKSGSSGKLKVIEISGEAHRLLEKISGWLKSFPDDRERP